MAEAAMKKLRSLWWYLTDRCPECGSALEYMPDDWADWYVECTNDQCDYSADR